MSFFGYTLEYYDEYLSDDDDDEYLSDDDSNNDSADSLTNDSAVVDDMTECEVCKNINYYKDSNLNEKVDDEILKQIIDNDSDCFCHCCDMDCIVEVVVSIVKLTAILSCCWVLYLLLR